MAAAPDARIRRICARQCAWQLAQMARALSLEGEHRAAFGALRSALTEAPFTWRIWRVLAGCVVRAAR
jgi:hypothetical protein